MGDKDIVKRAFKAFQNVNQLSPTSLVKPTTTNEVIISFYFLHLLKLFLISYILSPSLLLEVESLQPTNKRIEVKGTAPDALQKRKEG